MESKPKIVVIVGPTASGKTSLAIELAKEFDGEVISADSRQVYRELNIGTEKVTPGEMRGVPHHLIDIMEPTQVYTAAHFKRDAAAAIADITTRGKLPIIAGGTFFYIDILLGKISSLEVPPNEALRAELETKTPTQLYEQLHKLDPRRAAEIDKDNPRRLIRALEVATDLGNVPKTKGEDCPYEVLMIGIETDREELRARFRTRAAAWLKAGFTDEVANLLEAGVSRSRLYEIGFEYQLGLGLLDHTLTEAEFIDRFEEKNWQYAKRQLTWLKRDESIKWFPRDEVANIKKFVRKFLT